MGRSCVDVLSAAPVGAESAGALLLVETDLRLGRDNCEIGGVNTAGFVRLGGSMTDWARLRVLAASFTAGRIRLFSLEPGRWAQQVLDIIAASQPIDATLVFSWADESCRLADVAPFATLAATRIAEAALPTASQPGIDGFVRPKGSNADAAISVFQIVASLLAPETVRCMESQDLVQIFNSDAAAEVAQAVWLPPGRLVFRTPQDQGLVESTCCAAVSLSSAAGADSQHVGQIVAALRSYMRIGAHLFVSEPSGFCVPGWAPNWAREVSIVCAGSAA